MVNIMARRKTLVFGIGVNDSDYQSCKRSNKCQIYVVWHNMLERCYSAKFQSRQKAYVGSSVCNDWLYFSNFREWAVRQDWFGKCLDKDLLGFGSKVYSPETCAFVSQMVNNFIVCIPSDDGMTGSSFDKDLKKFRARCRNPFTGKKESIGYFDCRNDAHLSWKSRKHELSCQLAEIQTDERVAKALRTRYA